MGHENAKNFHCERYQLEARNLPRTLPLHRVELWKIKTANVHFKPNVTPLFLFIDTIGLYYDP